VKKEIIVVGLFCACAIAFTALNKSKENLLKSFEEEFESEEEEEAKTDQPDRYFEFQRGIRTREGSASPEYKAGFLTKEVNKGLASARLRRSSLAGVPPSNGVTAWTERGPANVPGRTLALLNLPGDATNNTWLAGAATGGIWKTVDGGSTWVEKSGDLPVMPISSFAISGSIIYAGTGEYVSTRLTAAGGGIFKSTDGGETWNSVANTSANEKFSIVTRVITDPANSDIIVASTVRSFWSTVSSQTSIMRSVNGGTSWTEVYTTTGAVEQVIATPGNFQVQYASLNGVGVLKSIDGGLNWSLSNTGMSPAGRIEIAVSPVTASKVFASAEGSLSGTGSDLYYSTNAGASWSLVDVQFNAAPLDFLIGQGFYDNTIMCDPFDGNIVYYGGVSLFRSTITTGGTSVDQYKLIEEGTDFMFLQTFSGIQWDNGRLKSGSGTDIKRTVEVRFGQGSQMAHYFWVPDGSTSGVADGDFTYKGYVTVPFQVWDVTNNKQLMVSFRDQNRNNNFDLVDQFLDATPSTSPLQNSREYVYIHNVDYSATESANIATAGGHVYKLAYNFFPCLAPNKTWDPNNLPVSKITVQYSSIPKLNANTITVCDSRGTLDGKNGSDQIILSNGVHPDHHYMIPIIVDANAKTYKILLGNDGGPFVSNVSTTPGIANGNWTWKGNTYITSQFYGADKKPGANQYVGGLQDNGTRISPAGQTASKTTNYNYAISGDGFEVLWHSLDGTKVLGSLYNNRIHKSTNGGSTFSPSHSGFTLEGTIPDPDLYPFFTRLANSKNFPDRVFAIGTDGVWRSLDFGSNWVKTAITNQWSTSSTFLDVEVSAANANIVWAGGAISASSRLHVSTDGGATFTPTNNYSENMGVISKLGSHPTEPNTAYALFSYANAPKILRTTNLGQTWEDISGFGTNDDSSTGFPDVAVFCIYVRPDNPNIIWVGTEIGIVESLNNGLTWGLLSEFPKVAVWDMKGQDDQVVIATHGRGIWTATISASQIAATPTIEKYGTSPKEELMLKFRIEESFDSVQIYNNTTLLGKFTNVIPSEVVVKVKNVTPGAKSIKTISYKGNAPFISPATAVTQLDILSVENKYITSFESTDDLTVTGFSYQFTPGTGPRRGSLQTAHAYPNNTDLSFLLRHPIKVSSTIPTLWYQDIAIVEPSDVGAVFGTPQFKDYVVMEASKNGLDWTPLLDGYNSRDQSEWLSAFNSSGTGNMEMYELHEVNLTDAYTMGDTLLVRYRLSTNASITGWGAAINLLAIQQEPAGLENSGNSILELSTFPNPSNGNFTAEYELKKPSEVQVSILNGQGKRIFEKALGRKEVGLNREALSLPNAQGNYLVIIKTNAGSEVSKIVIIK
jgi:photosystem II stability/assembly factor-like uncharacterized protein